MKNLLKPFLVILLSFYVTGCIQIETKVNINKDGSGTIEETVLMNNEMVQMLNEFITGFASDSAETEEFKLYNEEDLKNKETEMGEGVKFVSGSEYKTDNKQGYKVLYSFSDIGKVKIDQSPDSRIPDEATGVEVKDKKYVTFSFNKNDVSEIKINLPEPEIVEKEEEEMESAEDTTEDGDITQMKFLLKDLSFSFIININGEITETNADYRQDSEITLFTLNFGDLLESPEKLAELKKINPDNLNELKDIMKDIPGIKIETNDPVVIKFR